ncbi:hypothetical protein [Burkholderia sp. Bp9140]|uniref:hypothetical protein n=1 Tax=Burkholderia sp. Bp9140 TaxID=2184572 RepID=UPI000F560543|nr:hypothetical protein [Burkholderia sp. Bp9140]
MSERMVNQSKRELLYRKAHGKIILNEYLDKIASLFTTDGQWEMVPLKETDVILERFRAESARLKKEVVIICGNDLCGELSDVKKCQGGFYVLIDDDWRYCGILLVREVKGINIGVKLGEKILNDIIFISTDMSVATSFDFFEAAGRSQVEVTKWRAAG